MTGEPQTDYDAFLGRKVCVAKSHGFDVAPEEIHPLLRDHQRALVRWMVAGGRRACFAAFGLGKSVIQLEAVRLTRARIGGRALIVLPLGVRQEFIRDAAMLGTPVKFIRRIEEADDEATIYLTNYETVRDGKLDPQAFTVASLDEASVLRGFGGTKTFREFMRLFAADPARGVKAQKAMGTGVPYRFVATATPSPNEYIELLAYAAYLGILDVSQAKTRFFKRDSTKADQLTLHAHKEKEFWLWVSSWAILLQRPSDLGYSDEGYALPPMAVRWHEVPTDHRKAGHERDGQGRLIRNAALGVQDAAREKRESLTARVAKLREIVTASPDEHFLLWHDLEVERHAIVGAVPNATEVYGAQDLEERERRIIEFSDGEIPILATKPVLSGSGCNFQRHCHRAVFLGIGFKFNDFIQALHRIHRFLQTKPVEIDLIYTEAEREVRRTLERKWAQHTVMVGKMTEIIREYGLAHPDIAGALKRTSTIERVEVAGENYRLVNADAIEETRTLESDSVHLIVTSIPFCHDASTEVLTGRGWIGFGDLAPADTVATVNQGRRCFEWQRPTAIIWQHYSGEMLRFGNRSFDLLVTPNHRMLVARRGKGFGPEKLHLVDAATIALDYERAKRRGQARGRVGRAWRTCLVPPERGDGHRPSRISIPPLPANVRSGHGVQLYWIEAEDFVALAGWYLSEGHADSFSRGRSAGRISIAQVKNQTLRQEIADLFVRIGLPPSWHSRQLTVWCRNLAYFLIAEFGSGSKQKRIPAWVRELHPHLLTILRDTMMKGDGSRDHTTYTSYSKELRDHFQEICLKTGWRAAINGNYVYVGDKQIYPEIRRAPDRVTYDGMIGCATVPNGTIIVRRNGKPCISGNSTQYEYTPSYRDLGHTDDDAHFFQHLGYLTPELLRVLKPGRVCAVHVKDRIVPGGLTGLGFQTVSPFSDATVAHFRQHGFAFLGRKTVVTDVVRENNQTYRLGWTEQCKDGSRMGAGMPEYVLLFRKPPTDGSDGYADEPVVKEKAAYSRTRWQIDAHGFMRSGGNRHLRPEEIVHLAHDAIFQLFRNSGLAEVYDLAIRQGLTTLPGIGHDCIERPLSSASGGGTADAVFPSSGANAVVGASASRVGRGADRADSEEGNESAGSPVTVISPGLAPRGAAATRPTAVRALPTTLPPVRATHQG